MLLEAGGSPELINEVKEKSHGLGLFIRSLVGLDREAAKQAFSEFISGTTAAADQIEFINLIVEELTLRGFMAPERLFEAPFTNLSARGPLGVFPAPQVKQMVQVLNDIRARAAA
jgi:type I restriction enzyme R subunit